MTEAARRRATTARKTAALTTAAIAVLSLAAAPPASAEPAGRQAQFAAAAEEFGVPENVLLGVSYMESRWTDHAGDPSTGGGFGPMHLTDAAAVLAEGGGTHHGDGTEDPRGDESRPLTVTEPEPVLPDDASLQTLDAAAALTGVDELVLRTDPAQNIRGGAALLADYQRALGNPGDWYGAVARYSGAADVETAARFADDVYTLIHSGATGETDDDTVVLPADPGVSPDRGLAGELGLRGTQGTARTDCPRSLGCEWIPAPYEQYGPEPADYGNHDQANRERDLDIDYIVIHDIEGYYQGALNLVQDPTYVSWQYTLRSTDGHIAQHVKPEDVAWQAGNWYVNMHSIGLEHEGFAADGSWYTETMYRASARLVTYLADRFDVPLDRAHIIGHDNVPGVTPDRVRGMHWDPGPYWDWAHYFDLLRAPFRAEGGPRSGMVTIDPDFDENRPVMVGCDRNAPAAACPDRASSTVFLYSEPRFDAPLLLDEGLHPGGAPSTKHVSDHGSRVATGQRYAVAERRGEWTAIWYLGQKGWFHDPWYAPVSTPAKGFVVTPKKGLAEVPVYGRAYPEEAAYEGTGIPYQTLAPLQYHLLAGQRYTIGEARPSTDFYWAKTLDGPNVVVSGDMRYYEIQFGHRIMFVNAADVDVRPSWW